jgi:hypothetical protein
MPGHGRPQRQILDREPRLRTAIEDRHLDERDPLRLQLALLDTAFVTCEPDNTRS